MCFTCLFEVHDHSLLSTKYVALCTSYNTEITQYKHNIQYKHNQIREKIKNELIQYFRYIKILWEERYGKCLVDCMIWILEFGKQGQMIREDLDYLRYKW
jgi:hypothetical protein